MILQRKNKVHTNIWQSIEQLPIYNFRKCQEGDLRYLFIKWKQKPCKALIEIWAQIQDEFFERIEMNEKQSYIYRKSKKYIVNELEKIINENPAKLSRLTVENKKIEIELTKEQGVKQDIFDQVAILKIHFKIDIDIKKMSVLEYYKYLKIYEKQAE